MVTNSGYRPVVLHPHQSKLIYQAKTFGKQRRHAISCCGHSWHAKEVAHSVFLKLAATAAAAAVSLSTCSASAAEDLTITFRASRNPEVGKVQRALVEAWGYVETQFMDPELDHVKWKSELQDSINASYKATTASEAYAVTDNMLRSLNEPFTRLLRPGKQTTAFQNTFEGQIVALGLQLANAPNNQLQVGLVLDKSPAQAAGIQAGDILLEVNGTDVTGKSKEDLASDLQLAADLKLMRQPDASADAEPVTYNVHLAPGPIEIHPVQFSALTSAKKDTIGYIRLVVFSQNAASDVQHAIERLQNEDRASAFILDLRDNSGGVVAAGYNIAQLLLHDGDGFCIVKYGSGDMEVVQMQQTSHLLTKPMVVLVNNGTASASELLAGALHDAAGIPLIGEKTFGKGVTQRVVPLSDGSILLVSTASYMTPKHVPVHQVGLQPDIACKPEITTSEFFVAGSHAADDLLEDPCILLATERLQGILH